MADDLLTESDGPGAGGPQGGGVDVDLPSPLRPASTPSIKTGAAAKVPDEIFDIIEVDNEGNELGAPQPVAEPAPRAARAAAPPADQLPADSELEFVERPEFDAQGRELTRSQQKLQIRKTGRQKTFAENARLQAELRTRDDEIARLREQVETIGPRVVELGESEIRNRIATMKTELSDVERQFGDVEDRFFDAVQSGDKAAARVLGRQRDDLSIRRFQLTEAARQTEERLAQTANQRGARDDNLASDSRFPAREAVQQRQPAQRPAPGASPPLSRQAETLRSEFVQYDAPWITEPGNEMDKSILSQIDNAVMAEGFDPGTQDYWDELTARAEKYLPHRFANPEQPQQRQAAPAAGARRALAPQQTAPIRRGPPTAAPASAAPQANRNQVRIDPGRKEALIQAGLLAPDGTVQDKVRFNRAVKAYAEFDRANPVGTGR